MNKPTIKEREGEWERERERGRERERERGRKKWQKERGRKSVTSTAYNQPAFFSPTRFQHCQFFVTAFKRQHWNRFFEMRLPSVTLSKLVAQTGSWFSSAWSGTALTSTHSPTTKEKKVWTRASSRETDTVSSVNHRIPATNILLQNLLHQLRLKVKQACLQADCEHVYSEQV